MNKINLSSNQYVFTPIYLEGAIQENFTIIPWICLQEVMDAAREYKKIIKYVCLKSSDWGYI